jgi:predicted ATP-grasp superfamily ATP-dependent carboligase
MNKDIIYHKKVELEKPILLAGWPGMGNVAIGAMDYLRQKTNAQFFAEINTNKYLMAESILVSNGLAQMPRPLRNYFYYIEKPAIIFFESEVQLSAEPGVQLLQAIVQFCKEMNVSRIYTGAAFSLPVSHRDPSEVFGVGSNEEVVKNCQTYGVKPMQEGQISGLNGLLIGHAKEAGIDALCLLATMPVYAVNFPNPKASKALIEVVMKMTGINVDLKDLLQSVTDMETKMESIEENLRELFPDRKEHKKDDETEKFDESVQPSTIPPHVLDKIERFFREARNDREKAAILKEELDRWNLYKLYEDRFLNLFKEQH